LSQMGKVLSIIAQLDEFCTCRAPSMQFFLHRPETTPQSIKICRNLLTFGWGPAIIHKLDVKKKTLHGMQTREGAQAMAGKPQKNLAYSILLDFYGPVLTEKQRMILTEYYDEDLSLAEIAENLGITRQGVRDAIKHGEAALTDMEARLGYARRETALRAGLERLEQLTMEVRCCNTGLYTPVPQITRD